MESNGSLPCRKCHEGDLLPLSDFGSQGAPIHYKAWVCSNPGCGFQHQDQERRRLSERADSQRGDVRSADEVGGRPKRLRFPSGGRMCGGLWEAACRLLWTTSQ